MGDIPRDSYAINKTKHFVNVRQQIGKPLWYSDWNEMDDIRKYELQNFIKKFVGNGVPDNEGFLITPIENASNDFLIKKGHCLVNGRIVINENDIKYSDQRLPDQQNLPVLRAPQNNSRIDTVYLDVWEREVDSYEDPDLKDPGIAIETCVRIKREWVVRVGEGVDGGPATLPSPPNGHDYYILATLTRNPNEATISSNNITDKRFKGLNLEEIARSGDLSVSKFKNVFVTGTVGIGIPSPSEKLEVNGTVKANKFVGDGSDITALNGEKISTGTIDEARIPDTISRETRFDPTMGHKHTGVIGDGPKVSHSNLGDILEVEPTLDDTSKNKHISNALAKGWQDHITRSGNPHGLTLADLGALSTNGGTINGTLHVKGNVAIDGNAGIGTPTPGTTLDVVKADGVAISALSNAVDSWTGYKLGRTSAESSWGVAAKGGDWASDAAPGDVILRSEGPNHKLLFTTNFTRQSDLVLNNGSVGVGMVDPSNKLHVMVGDLDGIRVSGSDKNLGIGLLKGVGDGATPTAYNGALESWYGIAFRCSVDGIARHTFNTRDGSAYFAGNVGIGTEPTIGKLQFSNNAEYKIIFKDGGSTDRYGIKLNANNNLNVFIPKTSNFSINNTDPNGNETETEMFTVTGNGNLLIKMAGGRFASLTNNTFFNENMFQENNLKLSLDNIPLLGPPRTPSYDFIIGHTVPRIRPGPFRFTTDFVKRFSINQNGDLYCAGSKAGYVIDYFINRVGDTLEQGDVVVLSKYQVSQFSGTDNNIPIPEVDLTYKAYDTRVCGIVTEVVTEKDLPHVETGNETIAINEVMTENGQEEDQFIHPLHKYAAKISESLNPKKVMDQQIGKMATLGAFAHCKVDADIAPIDVGDLLTTSPTKGHAQKVIDKEKATGSIIGKALRALEKGRGKIPIMVMLQ